MARPHVMVVPYPVQGHVIPLMELSLYLVKHGIKITFVNTKDNHERILSSFPSGNDSLSQICLVWISDGLESSEERKKPGKSSEAVLRVMPEKVEELIECINGSESEKITCVLADQSIGWALDIAEKKGIQRAAFCPAAAAQLVLGLSIPKLIENGIIDKDGTPLEKQVIQLSPTIPSVSTEDLVWVCVGNQIAQKHIFQLMMKNIKSMKITEWLLCNSTYELEPAALSLAPEIIPIGPLLSSNQLGYSAGNFWSQDLTCLKWLDQQSPCSVIYVAFGSFTTFNPTQFQELCLGLELSNRPFLWVVQPDITEGTKYAYPEGFEERVAKHGRMVGWAPQQKILSHSSVACFISHCGWNSTMESVSNGIPILCWPCFADQFLNRSYICDVWKVGLGLERDGSGIITQSEIISKIEKLFNDEHVKARAADLKEKVQTSTGQGGLSNSNLDSFISWIKNIK
ncbi:UDP-glycosyltransferase 83A1-like [Gastrolobium bilobum]|uniref:UDP-glycosyltransferase 83A1-like n=1 Tax=Gastrolobium bilobum TaxID=150636 RepID=UPI002AB2D609|nr:UDP-glycosyltransferase 83A1-like [Gastrolobium bilobum]